MSTVSLTDPRIAGRIQASEIEGHTCQVLFFECPLCPQHLHAIHFGTCVGTGVMHWDHIGGSSVEDLTISPSYLARSPRGGRSPRKCRLHIYIRSGIMEILPDSKFG